MKIHPSSSLHAKKLPAIIYDELVNLNCSHGEIADSVPGLYKPDLCSWGVFNTKELFSFITCIHPTEGIGHTFVATSEPLVPKLSRAGRDQTS